MQFQKILTSYLDGYYDVEATVSNVIRIQSIREGWHTASNHLEQMADEFLRVKEFLTKEEQLIFVLAIGWYKVIYMAGKTYNEGLSILMFESDCNKMGIPKDIVDETSFWIDATREHNVAKADSLAMRLFLQADMAPFLLSRIGYKHYADSIYEEYSNSGISDKMFFERRKLLLEILKPEEIFLDSPFKERMGTANINICSEISTLKLKLSESASGAL